jgi:hypothetical protein
MQNAAGDGVAQAPHDQNAACPALVSDLVSLIERVQKLLRLIEQTIARKLRGKFRRKLRSATPRVPPMSSCSTTYLPAT